MKRKIILIAMLLALTGMIAIQSCKKEAPVPFTEHNAFTTPTVVAPEDGATINLPTITGEETLTWASTNASGDPIKADVYFGTSGTPPLYQAGVTALTLNVPVERGLTYYWRVVMIDANGIKVNSPTFSFTIFDPITIFTGTYNADEPAESYFYDVTFTVTSHTTLITHNYWNSGWDATFTLDFTANTYSMPLTVWGGYSGIESGTIDQATGTMVGDYTIYQGATAIETGTHTYTKK
jgi:hypothetical protein